MPRSPINGEYRFDWLPTQRKFLNAIGSMQFSNILWCAGFGGGKTRCIGEVALQLSGRYPGVEIGFWRKSRASIKDTTYRIFREQVLPDEFIRRKNETNLMIIDRNGSRYDFLGMDRITRKGSYFFDVVFIEEAIEFEEHELKMIEGRLRSKHVPRPLFAAVTNAGMPGSILHKQYVKPEKKDDQFLYLFSNSFENVHNPPSYFERLKKWEGSQYYSRYVLSQWTAFHGAVYEMYDPEKHICKPFKIPDNWPKRIGVDFGYEHPQVILWVALDPGTGRRYVYRQFYKSRVMYRDSAKLGKQLQEKTGERYRAMYADHDAEGRAQFDTDWMETQNARKEVMSGIQSVQAAFLPLPDGKPGLQIFDDSWSNEPGCYYGNIEPDLLLKELGRPTCLQDELPAYEWGKDDKPVKERDDGVDSLRYVIYSEKCEEVGDGGVTIVKKAGFGRR